MGYGYYNRYAAQSLAMTAPYRQAPIRRIARHRSGFDGAVLMAPAIRKREPRDGEVVGAVEALRPSGTSQADHWICRGFDLVWAVAPVESRAPVGRRVSPSERIREPLLSKSRPHLIIIGLRAQLSTYSSLGMNRLGREG
jgi:hypothetical protein